MRFIRQDFPQAVAVRAQRAERNRRRSRSAMIDEPPNGEVRIGVFHSPRFPKSRRQPAIGLKSTVEPVHGDLQVHKDAVRGTKMTAVTIIKSTR